MMYGNLLYGHAWLAILRGDTAKAWDLIQECSKLRWVKGTALGEAHLSYAAAMLLHPRNEQLAMQYLQQVKLIGDQVGSSLLQFMSSLLEAHFAIEEGQNERGIAVLRHALAIGRERGFSYFSWWIPQIMARLCAKALEEKIEVEYVQELIRKTRLAPDADASTSEAWPWPVKIYTFGRFEVYVNGQPLPRTRKAPYRVLQMLQVIIALGGQEVSMSRLIDVLWPNAEGDTGQETFNKTLQRLRRLLSHDNVIQVKEGKVSLNRQVCWVDTTAFQTLLNGTDDSKHRQSQTDARIQRYEKAVVLYRGPFLGREDSYEWIEHCRERLRHQFVRSVQHVSDWKKAGGQENAAVACLENGLQADPLAEPIYPRLIKFFQAVGRQDDAKTVWAQYRKAVVAAGREPSAEMQYLAKQLSIS
jgi:LuxR family maltose regulon positive regulatory protein